MASESIAHSAFGLMGYDSGPIRAQGIFVVIVNRGIFVTGVIRVALWLEHFWFLQS